MKINRKYHYPKTVREAINGQRHYNIDNKEKLPSVTTIISATQSAEKREKLAEWRARVERKKQRGSWIMQELEELLCTKYWKNIF